MGAVGVIGRNVIDHVGVGLALRQHRAARPEFQAGKLQPLVQAGNHRFAVFYDLAVLNGDVLQGLGLLVVQMQFPGIFIGLVAVAVVNIALGGAPS